MLRNNLGVMMIFEDNNEEMRCEFEDKNGGL